MKDQNHWARKQYKLHENVIKHNYAMTFLDNIHTNTYWSGNSQLWISFCVLMAFKKSLSHHFFLHLIILVFNFGFYPTRHILQHWMPSVLIRMLLKKWKLVKKSVLESRRSWVRVPPETSLHFFFTSIPLSTLGIQCCNICRVE